MRGVDGENVYKFTTYFSGVAVKTFENKRVYITGGSMGIGLAIAKEFAVTGADVVIFARSEGPLKEAVSEIRDGVKSDRQVVDYILVDVVNDEACQSVMRKAVSTYGVCDVLICCPGGAKPGYFETISAADFDHTMRLNLYSTRNTIASLVPFMKANGGGHIVALSSIAGFLGVFGYTDYCASKFALIGFSEALKSELRPFNINVSVLCPPDTDTPGLVTENQTKPEETKAISENAKLMSAEAVAKGLIRGLKRNQFLIIPGFDGKLVYFLKRFFPSLIEWVMTATIKKVQKKRRS